MDIKEKKNRNINDVMFKAASIYSNDPTKIMTKTKKKRDLSPNTRQKKAEALRSNIAKSMQHSISARNFHKNVSLQS